MIRVDSESDGDLGQRVKLALRRRLSLREDKADDTEIDERIRAGVEMRGTNLWVLMFAIFIASIGLNVNSTAVIIGAMLISPLMGPIMGVGYGLGIYDFPLVRKSLKNIGIATLISLLTSTAYFLVSPLTTADSELIARTTPTIWDVLIAFFGGMAGIIASTREEKSTAIPGVAIATALMPPLCTAGYGMASANWQFFLGASFLFAINCVFIATSTAILVLALRLPHKRFVDARTAVRVHRLLGVIAVLTVLPSLYLTYLLLGEEIFKSRAMQFVRNQMEFKQSHVVTTHIDAKSRRIEVTLVGEVVPENTLADVTNRLASEGLAGSELKVYQAGDQRIDVAGLKSSLLADLYRESRVALEKKDEVVKQLRDELALLNTDHRRFTDIPAELHALYPQVEHMMLSSSPDWHAETGWNSSNTVMVSFRTSKPLSQRDRARIEDWLRARLKTERMRVIIENREPAPARARK